MSQNVSIKSSVSTYSKDCFWQGAWDSGWLKTEFFFLLFLLVHSITTIGCWQEMKATSPNWIETSDYYYYYYYAFTIQNGHYICLTYCENFHFELQIQSMQKSGKPFENWLKRNECRNSSDFNSSEKKFLRFLFKLLEIFINSNSISIYK